MILKARDTIMGLFDIYELNNSNFLPLTDLGKELERAVRDGRPVLEAFPRVVGLEPAEHELVVLRLAVFAEVLRPRLQVRQAQCHLRHSQFLLRREVHFHCRRHYHSGLLVNWFAAFKDEKIQNISEREEEVHCTDYTRQLFLLLWLADLVP